MISSDFCRGLVADDENDQSATRDAFDVLHYIAGKRLAAGRLTVVDATNVQADARRSLVALAREHDVLPVAVVLDVPEGVCVSRNADRADRDFGAAVIHRQRDQLRRGLKGLAREGSARCTRCGASRRSPPHRSCAPRCTTTCATTADPSTSSATCTAAARSSRAAGGARLDRAATTEPTATPRAAGRCSSATSSTAGPTRRGCCGPRWRWSTRAPRSAARGQPRGEALALARGQARQGLPRARGEYRAARARAGRVPEEVRRFLEARPSPLRARRGPAGGRPRGAEGAHAHAHRRQGARVRALR